MIKLLNCVNELNNMINHNKFLIKEREKEPYKDNSSFGDFKKEK